MTFFVFARIALICVLLNAVSALAQTTPVQVSQDAKFIDLSLDGLVLEDPNGNLSLEDVRSDPVGSRFKPGSFVPGFTPSAYWFKFTLRNGASTPRIWWLDSGDRFMQEVDLFWPDAGGIYQRQSASSTRPFSERPLPTSKFVFPVSLEPGKTVEIYLRAQSKGFMPVAFYPSLWKPEAHQEAAKLIRQQWIFYLGMATALISFNFLLFLFIRDKNYLFYVLAQISMAWWVGTSRLGTGIAYEFFWPNAPLFDQLAIPLSSAATSYFAYLFQSQLMALPTTKPNIDRFWRRSVWITVLCFGFSALGTLLPQLMPVFIRQAALFAGTFCGLIFIFCNVYAVYVLIKK